MRAVIGATTAAAVLVIGITAINAVPDQEIAAIPAAIDVPASPEPAPMMAAFAEAPAIVVEETPVVVPAAEVILAAAEIEPVEQHTTREPMLCAFWAIQRMAEGAGIIEVSGQGISDQAFPVPAPVWVMNALMNMAEKLDA